jgi:hypothetical protein
MYKFREIELANSQKKLLIDFDDDSKELLSTFLESEVTTFHELIIQYLDKVLENDSESEEFNGNVCGIEIGKETTKIYDNLADDGEGHWCEIETKELRGLVDIWLAKLDEFNSNGKSL